MKIAILGAGNVGGTLGKAWANQGHQVTFGVRNPEAKKTQTLLQEIGDHARATTITDAALGKFLVSLRVPLVPLSFFLKLTPMDNILPLQTPCIALY